MANKATKFIKQYFFMLALAATFVGFSAFKFSEQRKSFDTRWYAVTLNNPNLPNDPSNQLIGDEADDDPENGESETECATENEGIICTVQLNLDDPGDKPATVADANAITGMVQDFAYHPEE